MLKFYEVDGDFVDYLRKYEPQIPYINSNQYKTYKNKKFFCGIILNINGFNYFSPVSSYNKSNLTSFPIKDITRVDPITKAPIQISSLRLGFMFPCPINLMTVKNFSKETIGNRNLLRKELGYCNSKITNIKKQAQQVYNLSLKEYSRNKYHICNFSLLEEKCKEWEEVNDILLSTLFIKNKDDLFYIYDELTDKNNFEKVVRILDNDNDSKNIININIKDLENKRIPTLEELTTSVYEKIKEKTKISFDDCLNDLKDYLGFEEENEEYINEDGKFSKLLSEEEINNLKEKILKNFQNFYNNLKNNSYLNTIYENKNAKINLAGDVILENPPIKEITSEEKITKQVNNLLGYLDYSYKNEINWCLSKPKIYEKINEITDRGISIFMENIQDLGDVNKYFGIEENIEDSSKTIIYNKLIKIIDENFNIDKMVQTNIESEGEEI